MHSSPSSGRAPAVTLRRRRLLGVSLLVPLLLVPLLRVSLLRVPLVVSLRRRGSAVAATRRTLLIPAVVALRGRTAKAAGRALVVLRAGLVSALVVPSAFVGLLVRRLPSGGRRRLVEALHAWRNSRRSLFVDVELSPGVLTARAEALLPRLRSSVCVLVRALVTDHLAGEQVLSSVEDLCARLRV